MNDGIRPGHSMNGRASRCAHSRPAVSLLSVWVGYFSNVLVVFEGKKKEPKPKLFGPDIFGWGVGLPREGVGAKKFGMAFETQETKLFAGISRDFAGISRGRPKSLRKKIAFNSCPLVFEVVIGCLLRWRLPFVFRVVMSHQSPLSLDSHRPVRNANVPWHLIFHAHVWHRGVCNMIASPMFLKTWLRDIRDIGVCNNMFWEWLCCNVMSHTQVWDITVSGSRGFRTWDCVSLFRETFEHLARQAWPSASSIVVPQCFSITQIFCFSFQISRHSSRKFPSPQKGFVPVLAHCQPLRPLSTFETPRSKRSWGSETLGTPLPLLLRAIHCRRPTTITLVIRIKVKR